MIGCDKMALVLGLVLVGPVQAGCGPSGVAENTPQGAMTRLAGQWERKEGKTTISLSFTEDGRLHVVVTGGGEGFTLHSDCQVSRDGIAYGIVTSAELAVEEKEDEITDQVFRFRFRVDEGTLIVRNFKSSAKSLEDEKTIWEGRFRSVQPTRYQVAPACCYPPAAVVPYTQPVCPTSYKPVERLVPTPLPAPR